MFGTSFYSDLIAESNIDSNYVTSDNIIINSELDLGNTTSGSLIS